MPDAGTEAQGRRGSRFALPGAADRGVQRAAAGLRTVLTAALLAAACTAAAAALAPPAFADPGSGAEGAEAAPDAGAAAYYADLLDEEEPGAAVAVADELAGGYDRAALADAVRKSFAALDVPFYVVVAPWESDYGLQAPLAPIMDRVERDGLYVLLDPEGFRTTAAVSGVDLPVEEAERYLLFSDALTDAGLAEQADRMAEALGAPDIAARAEQARAESEAERESEDGAGGGGAGADSAAADPWPEGLSDIDPRNETGSANLGLLTGSAAGAALCWAARRFYLRRRDKDARMGPRIAVVLAVPALVIGAGAGVSAAAADWLPQRGPAPEPEEPPPGTAQIPLAEAVTDRPPYVADSVRVERIAAGLAGSGGPGEADTDASGADAAEPAGSGVYVDPKLAAVVPPDEAEALAEAAAAAELPVRVAVVPMNGADESLGDMELLAHALRHTVGKDGLYVVIEPRSEGSAAIDAVAFGPGPARMDVLDAAEEAMTADQEAGPAAMGQAVIATAEGGQGTQDPERPRIPGLDDGDTAEEDPDESRIAGFFSGDGVWPGLLLVGPLLWGLWYGAAALFRSIGPHVAKQRTLAWLIGSVPPRDTSPSKARLKRLRDRELAALQRTVTKTNADHPQLGQAAETADAVILLDGMDPDGLDLAGSVVLLRRARIRLETGDPGAYRYLCEANPLHGEADGSDDDSLCRGCDRAPREARAARRLRVDVDGAFAHVTSANGRDWARSRFGATGPDPIEAVRRRAGVH